MIKNPILKGFNPDPSICRVNNDYYIAVSTFEWFPGVQIYQSKDLVNWSWCASPANRVSQLNMLGNPDSGGVWAPCLSYSDGKFWLIYSDVKVVDGNVFKDTYNYLITCESIDGEWSDPIFMNGSGFDPSLYHDLNGKKYFTNMIWDHRSYNHSFYGIVLQEYSHSEKKLIGESKIIFKGTHLGVTEAPHIYKVNDYYYLMCAEGGTKYEHAVTIARSKNIDGPYEVHPNNPILTSWHDIKNPIQKSGHASMVETQNGEWYLAHLMGRPLHIKGKTLFENRGYCPLGRETAIQKLYWENDWPFVVDGPTPSNDVESSLPILSKNPIDYLIKDDFNDDVLNHNFNTLRIPFSDEIGSLSEKPGRLRLYGRESLHSTFIQAHIARRWQSFNFDASTKLNFDPNNFQQSAGLTCYYNTKNWTYLNISNYENKGKIIDLIVCDQYKVNYPLKGKEIIVPKDVDIYFKVEVRGLKYCYKYSFDGIDWLNIDIELESYKLSDDYIIEGGFFTGAFVGMYCCDLTGMRKEADFDYFEYKEL